MHQEFEDSFPYKKTSTDLLYRVANPATDLVDRLNKIQEKYKSQEEIPDDDLLIIYTIWLQDKYFTLNIANCYPV